MTLEQKFLQFLKNNQLTERRKDTIRHLFNREFKIKVSQSTFSNALKKLEDKGLIECGYFIKIK